MLKIIVDKEAKLEYKIQIENLSGENRMTCPVCSEGRTKSEDQCLWFNAGIGAGKCNHCEAIFYEKKSVTKIKQRKLKKLERENSRSSYIRTYFKSRGISTSVAIGMGVTTTTHYFDRPKKELECICFNYFVGDEIFYKKFKTIKKEFSSEGCGDFFYNHNAFIKSALFSEDRYIIIVEGEDEVLAIKSAGFEFVVSVPTGAKGHEFLDKYDKYFENMDRVYIAVDQDEDGYNLEQELIRRYNTGCCYKVNLKDCHDNNDYLKKYGAEDLKQNILDAVLIPTEGIVRFSEVTEKAWRIVHDGYEKGVSTAYPKLDEFFTWRPKEITLFSGFANHGKTTAVANLTVIKSILDGWKWAVFTPEYGSAEDFYLDMSEIYLGKTIVKNKYHPRTATDKQVQDSFDFIDDHFFFVYPKTGIHTLETITKEVASNVRKHGINGVIIDPFNQLHRNAETTSRDIVVQQFVRQAKAFATKFNLCFIVVVHPKTAGERDPKEPNQYCIEEGDSWNKAVSNLCTIHRPDFQKAPESTRTIFHWWKIKRQGKVGKRGSMIMEYNLNTYRYYQSEDDFCPFPNPPTENYKEERRRLRVHKT